MACTPSATAGTVVAYTPNAGVLVEILGVEDISVSPGSKTEIDVTALKDTAKATIGGQPEYGELTITYFHDPADAGQAAVLTAASTAGSSGTLKVTMTDAGGATIEYDGYFHGWAPSFPKNGANMCSAKFKISGAPTLTP